MGARRAGAEQKDSSASRSPAYIIILQNLQTYKMAYHGKRNMQEISVSARSTAVTAPSYSLYSHCNRLQTQDGEVVAMVQAQMNAFSSRSQQSKKAAEAANKKFTEKFEAEAQVQAVNAVKSMSGTSSELRTICEKHLARLNEHDAEVKLALARDDETVVALQKKYSKLKLQLAHALREVPADVHVDQNIVEKTIEQHCAAVMAEVDIVLNSKRKAVESIMAVIKTMQ